MAETKNTPVDKGYLLYYHRPVQSRNGRLWLCFVNEEKKWALSSNPYFPKSVDLGFRWDSRMEGVILLNMVSDYSFGSDAMFSAISKCNATLARTAKKKRNLSIYSEQT